MIYELAVYVDEPIRPRQIIDRSNKFVWGNHDCHVSPRARKVLRTSEQPLTAMQLPKVCRGIYKDLEEFPVFYRINKFSFLKLQDLHSFLVAITPLRRSMIRSITWHYDDWTMFHSALGKVFMKYHAHILTMLLECVDLREFVLFYDSILPRESIQKFLKSVQAADGKWSLWNLPTLNLQMSPKFNARYRPGIIKNDEMLSQLSQIQTILASRKQHFLEEERHGRGLKAMIRGDALQTAVVAANVDVPGEDRVTQDMFNSSSSGVSSRTRRRCLLANYHADTGTIEGTDEGKYDAEGILRGEPSAVTQVRWGESTIECKVSWDIEGTWTSRPSEFWEDLHAILSPSGLFHLGGFYRELIQRARKDVNELEKLRDIPSPKDVTDISHELLKGWKGEKGRLCWARYVREWENYHIQFEKLKKHLKDEVSSHSQTKGKSSSRKQKK